MEKTVYITEEEREKCRKVIDVFEELYEIEDEDILLVDVGRYGFVKLQCYTASHGFEELDYVQSLKCFVSVSFLLFVRLIIVFLKFRLQSNKIFCILCYIIV